MMNLRLSEVKRLRVTAWPNETLHLELQDSDGHTAEFPTSADASSRYSIYVQ